MTEENLIKACLKNNRKAQKILYTKYAPKMMGICLRYASDKEKAHDYLQDGFVQVFLFLHTFEHKGSFEGWMRKIFVNTALAKLRKNDPLRETKELDKVDLTDGNASALSQLSAKELIALVQALPDGFRTIFNLYAIEGYSHKEIAELLQISEGTSRSQYQRARGVLKKKVQELYER